MPACGQLWVDVGILDGAEGKGWKCGGSTGVVADTRQTWEALEEG